LRDLEDKSSIVRRILLASTLEISISKLGGGGQIDSTPSQPFNKGRPKAVTAETVPNFNRSLRVISTEEKFEGRVWEE
jgi:hypothetical protein